MTFLEQSLAEIPAFAPIHAHLFSSGQPSAEQLKCIKEYGFSTVINLALNDADPHLDHEDRICLELGLNYIHLPMLWDMPNAEQGLLILDLIDHLVGNEMVWIHCAKNYRVSCLMYLYRQYYMDIDISEAQTQLEEVWQPNETWTGIIHSIALQLQGRKATRDIQNTMNQSDHFT